MKKIYMGFLCLIFTVGITNTDAKDTQLNILSTAGTTYHNNQVNLVWTIGEGFVKYHQSPVNVNEGFHQVIIEKSTDAVDIAENQYNLSVYPNPANDYMIIESAEKTMKNITLTDIRGKKLLVLTNINNMYYKLNIIENNAGNYFLDITTTDDITFQFKVQLLK